MLISKNMKVLDIIDSLGLKLESGQSGVNREIDGGYVSDLLSDVMGNSREGQVWVTLQTHKNVMAIASLKDLAAVILVKGFKPDEDMAKQSEEEGIPVLSTTDNAFEIAGKLYEILK
jgi:predicted transcriptional regulator